MARTKTSFLCNEKKSEQNQGDVGHAACDAQGKHKVERQVGRGQKGGKNNAC